MLIVAQLVNNFSIFYGIGFIAVFTRASYLKPDESNPMIERMA
jgi:hypothetical protein